MATTYINNASSVSGEDKLALLPLVVHSLVKHTGDDLVIRRIAHGLFQKQHPVQCEQTELVASTDHDFTRHIVDSCTLNMSVQANR